MAERRKSNIGRILKGLKETPDKVSIVEVINKACSSGATSAGAFSLTGIKRQLRTLLSLLDEEEFNRDSFFLEFSKFYSIVMAPDKRAKGVFHPSQLLDGCKRAMTYELMGTPYSDRAGTVTSAELQRTFDVGTWYHVYIQSILYREGVLEQAEVPVVNKDKYLSGKTDGVLKESVFGEKVVLEIKTMNSWSFSRAIFKPFKKHEFQASLYARELGIKKVLYLYINKDTSEIREFLVPVNEEQLAMADEKMFCVIRCVKEKTLPARTCKDRFCDEAISCPYASLCFGL